MAHFLTNTHRKIIARLFVWFTICREWNTDFISVVSDVDINYIQELNQQYNVFVKTLDDVENRHRRQRLPLQSETITHG